VVGLSTAFYLNAVSYVGVLAAYLAMDTARLHASQDGRRGGNIFKQVGEGLRYSWRTPPVLLIFILIGFIGTFGYNFTVIVPLVAEFVLKVGPGKFGLLTSFMGLGSLVSALVLAGLGRTSQKVLWGGAVGFVVVFAATAVSQSFAVTCVLMALLGFAGVTFSTTLNTGLQIMVPNELRGRVMSIFFLLFAGSTPIGGYLTGALSERIGVSATLLIEAGLCAIGVAIAAAYRLAHRAAFQVEPRGALKPEAA
jgi:predicted MFS family arabinose efflux permease